MRRRSAHGDKSSQQQDQVEAHGREGEPVAGKATTRPQRPAPAPPQPMGSSSSLRACRLTSAIGTAFTCRPRNEQPVDQKRHAKVDRRHHLERRPPAGAFDQELGEGNAEGAGQAAEEGHQENRLPVARAVDPGDHGEGQLVGDDEPGRRRGRSTARRTSAANRPSTTPGGAAASSEPPVVSSAAVPAIDPGADQDGAQAGDQQAGRQRAEHGAARPAELLRPRHVEQREGVVDQGPTR